MAENYSFFNSKDHDRKYNAKHWADYFFPLFKSGVFNGGLQVVADEGMSVKIGAGYAWIDGYAYHLTDDIKINLEIASGNMNRIDNIVIRLDLTNRWIKSYAVTGSYYSGAATAPVPEISDTIHELVIAQVNIAAGTTKITQDMITDTRMNTILCGWVRGAVEQIDFAQITAQFDAFLEVYKANILSEYGLYTQNIGSLETQAQERYDEMDTALTGYEEQQKVAFETWVESIKGILGENAAGNLLLMIGTLANLTTEAKGNLVEAINEVNEKETELSNSLGGFQPVIDETGKITGYKTTAGADTVYPFSSGIEGIEKIYSDTETTSKETITDVITLNRKYKAIIAVIMGSVSRKTSESGTPTHAFSATMQTQSLSEMILETSNAISGGSIVIFRKCMFAVDTNMDGYEEGDEYTIKRIARYRVGTYNSYVLTAYSEFKLNVYGIY